MPNESSTLMTLNRIQKLLFTEYSDFEDHVLLECPFAQTTRDGEGIQQLHIGLTPTKLILAKDYLEWRDDPASKEDPVVGTLELVSMLPVEFVNLSVYRRKTRNTIKARFCNQQVLYFELAACFRREMFWNLWCERMKFLCPEDDKRSSSSSEASVSSSTSSSTLNFRSYTKPKNWDERNLYLGNDFKTENYVMSGITNPSKQISSESIDSPEKLHSDPIESNKTIEKDKDSSQMNRPASGGECQRVYRFGSGIDENCFTSLYLPSGPAMFREFGEPKSTTSDEESATTYYQMMCLTEEAVRVWEKSTPPSGKKHKRSSALMPYANHMSGLGHEEMTKGEAFSVQMKRSASAVNLSQISDEVKTGIPKRLLISSISCECLKDCEKEDLEDLPVRQSWRYNRTIGVCTNELAAEYCIIKGHKIYMGKCVMHHGYRAMDKYDFKLNAGELYWTPREPDFIKPAPQSYKMLRKHLTQLDNYRKSIGVKKKTSIWTRIKRPHNLKKDAMVHVPVRPKRSYNTLRKQLKMDITVSSWDFDSTILAYQLTLLDRDFFLMIPPTELQTLITERSSRNAPYIRLMSDFSDRITNLIVTEIVRLDSLKMRARLIGKYINVADKLHRLHNMHSTHSVLGGLTMPAVHRLNNTWMYMRRHHYSKYKRLNTLLKLYRDVRTPLYCKMFEKFSRTPPYLPSIKCITYGLLGHLPKASYLSGSKSYHSFTSFLWSHGQRLPTWRTQSAGGSLASETTRNSMSSDSGEVCNLDYHEFPYCKGECGQNLRLEAAKASLKMWQHAATTYDLIESPLVKEFLLKAKFLEGGESFHFSKNIEANGQVVSLFREYW